MKLFSILSKIASFQNLATKTSILPDHENAVATLIQKIFPMYKERFECM